jgi:hypothetical protein
MEVHTQRHGAGAVTCGASYPDQLFIHTTKRRANYA